MAGLHKQSDLLDTFEPYGLQHLGALGIALVSGYAAVAKGKQLSNAQATVFGTLLAIPVALVVLAGIALELIFGTFDAREDLPLHLCRLLAILLPFAIYFRSEFWLRIFYFWILAGTLQALVTPDLAEGFPQFWCFRYWILHAGLVILTLYTLAIFRLRPGWRDFWRAVIFAQGYVILIHGANLLLGSNYSYTMRKPPGGSLLDLFGEWPWYILGGEAIMFVFFFLLLLPFQPWKKSSGRQSHP